MICNDLILKLLASVSAKNGLANIRNFQNEHYGHVNYVVIYLHKSKCDFFAVFELFRE